MTWFYLAVLVLLIFAFSFVLIPSIRGRKHDVDDTPINDLNVKLARQRLAELQQERSAGVLSDEDYKQAEQELTMALATELRQQHASTTSSFSALWLSALFALSVSGVVYWQASGIGKVTEWHQAYNNLQPLARKILIDQDPTATEQEYMQLILAMRTQVHKNPQQWEGWLSLGKLYGALGYAEQAIEALTKALELKPSQVDVQYALAEAIIASEQQQQYRFAAALLQRVQEQQPQNLNAKVLYALLGEKTADSDEVVRRWQQVAALLDPSSDAYAGLQAKIRDLQGQGTRLVVNFSVAPTLQSLIPDNATLFVLAKSAQGGPPMPAAVIKTQYDPAIRQVVLTEQDAMLADYTLSALQQAQVIVRISASGQAAKQNGDIEGIANLTLSPGTTQSVNIEINTEVSQ